VLVQGGREVGEALVDDPACRSVSATGSTRMGREVAPRVAARFGRTLLELGGNNGMIVAPSADLDLAERGDHLRRRRHGRPALHDAAPPVRARERLRPLVPRLKQIWAEVPVGNPLEDGTLVGPLIDGAAFEAMQAALAQARAEGGTVHGGERLHAEPPPDAFYVRPAIVEMPGRRRSRCARPSRRSST
jgi:aldehyde dehydrogenase (NAD+)